MTKSELDELTDYMNDKGIVASDVFEQCERDVSLIEAKEVVDSLASLKNAALRGAEADRALGFY